MSWQHTNLLCGTPHTRTTGWYDCVHHCGKIKSALISEDSFRIKYKKYYNRKMIRLRKKYKYF
jgi:hypothetical protein